MRNRPWANAAVLAGLFAAAAFAQSRMLATYSLPHPHFDTFIGGERATQDVALTVSGFRRVAAGLAWLQFLQHLGSHGEFKTDVILAQSQRVVRLDPTFLQAYIYGAGILAFYQNLNGPQRPDLALELLKEGIGWNPADAKLKAILASILFKLDDKPAAMMSELERLAVEPGGPVIMRAILANLYMSRREFRKAAAIWSLILNSPITADERERAERKLAEVRRSMRKN